MNQTGVSNSQASLRLPSSPLPQPWCLLTQELYSSDPFMFSSAGDSRRGTGVRLLDEPVGLWPCHPKTGHSHNPTVRMPCHSLNS